jgi:hypothetical protein
VIESESVLDHNYHSRLYTPCWSSLIRPCAPIQVQLLLESEWAFAAPIRVHFVLESKYTILLRECFYRFTPTLSGKSVCGQLLIRSILVLLLNFEVPLKKKL